MTEIIEWSKNGDTPVSVLPGEDIGKDGKIWTHLTMPDNQIARDACGWVQVEHPSFDPLTEMLEWVKGDEETPGYYNVVPKPLTPPPPPPPPVVKVSHKEFLDLLTTAEQIKLKGAQKQLASQTAAEYAASGNLIFKLFSVAMDQFEKSSMIELTHPQTIAAIKQIMVPMGILTNARADQILANVKPT